MSAASKAMMLDVAKTPEQFERLTKVAVRLGQAMGLDAARSIDDFVTAAGRQSIMIADNLGLTVKAGEANKKYADELGKTVKQLTAAERKQAFLNAMLDAGEKKTAAMGESTGDARSKIEKLESAVSDAKKGFAELGAKALDAVGDVDKLAESIRKLPGAVELFFAPADEFDRIVDEENKSLAKASDSFEEYEEAAKAAGMITAEEAEETRKLAEATDEAGKAVYEMYGITDIAATKMSGLRVALSEAEFETRKYQESVELGEVSARRLAAVLRADMMPATKEMTEEQKALERSVKQWEAANRDTIYSMDSVADKMAMMAEPTGEYKAQLEALAEQERVWAQETADYAFQSTMSWKDYFGDTREGQEEFAFDLETAEETHQAKMAELLIEGDATKIAEEEAYYQRKMESMRAMHAEEEEEQQESLGRMLLQQFEAWTALKNIPAEKAMEMRTAIALEYGLMDAESARVVGEMTGSWEAWADGFDQSAMDVMGDMDAVISHAASLQAAIDRIPRKVPIEILISQTGGISGIEAPEWLQHGTPNFRGGLAMLGERGPELAVLPPATQVYNSTTTRSMMNQYNLTTQSMVRPGGLAMEFETMRMASR